ncbi:MAG: DUF4906 domain-containing protein [Muribaculaceae bacterium]|nr:DUF4906 domain-containing protein [Muribaculaceae bacterium]
MRHFHHILNISLPAAIAMLAIALASCRDEDLGANFVEPGRETYISLSVSLPEAQKYTRADMDPIIENRINNLWVGVYSASSGKRIYSEFRDETTNPGDFPVDVTPNHTTEKWGTVKAETGRCFIVAVANSVEQPAVDVRTGEDGIMKDMIENADSWEDFRAIAVEHLPGNVYVPRPARDVGLYMAGCYYEKLAEDPDGHNWEGLGAINISQVSKDEKNPVQLPGAIHLRRPYSQIKFEIVPDYNVIELRVDNYQVCNVPTYSWVYERAQQNASATNILGYANAGDAVNPDFASNGCYPASVVFSSANMTIKQEIPKDSDGKDDTANAYNKYSFDFWMPENKRTGTDVCTDYTDREREFSTPIPGAPADVPNSPVKTNTGIYSSLCNSPEGDLNNNATYVKLDCTIVYKAPGEGTAVRTAETSYIVHLGYIGKDAKDFNTYRNAKYTYKLKVSGVNNILVEARRDDDRQPSAEGTVTDAESQGYDLDAHFNVFNISFSEDDLQKYNFIMESYFYNQRHIVETGNIPAEGTDEWKYYYDWVQLVKIDNKTRTKDELDQLSHAKYPKNSGDLLHLDDIKTSGKGTYTVFVNEYVYEKSDDESNSTNWKGYVNQPSRRFWIRVTEKTSEDGESTFCTSKYYALQRSIQTYYDPANPESANALGIEHINECFGMNLDWKTQDNDRWDSKNGRYNLYTAVGDGSNWNTCLDLDGNKTKQQKINAITNDNQKYYGNTSERYYTVPLSLTTSSAENSNKDETFYPQIYDPKQYVDAATACMNRNRDENGNGVIDKEEIKWFLPASEQMLRIIIGEKDLVTPLLSYNKPSLPFYCQHGENALYHFALSNNKILWAEEGCSTSQFGGGLNNNWNKVPWEMRCIRYLGTNLTKTPSKGTVAAPAYETETYGTVNNYTYNSGVVKVPYFYGAALRDNSYDPLPLHKVVEDDNKLARYGFEVAPKGNTFVRNYTSSNPDESTYTNSIENNATKATIFNDYNTYVNTPVACNALAKETGRDGWRIPNQREIAIMMNMGILSSSPDKYMTCTQEYWAHIEKNAYASLTPGADFRIVTIQMSNTTGTAWNDSYNIGSTYGIRCVRDLTAAEENMTYAQIRAHKTNKPGRRSPAVSTKQSGAFRLGVLARPPRR